MTLLDKTLSALGLMRVAEHDCDLCDNMREVPDSAGLRSYQETAPCPKCRDGSWSYQAAKRWHRKFLTAVTDLEATIRERDELRPDAEKWRARAERERQRGQAKRKGSGK
jgi:hypothetical protein